MLRTCIWLLHPAATSAQDGLDPCDLHWWCFSCHQLAQRSHLHLQCTVSATCSGFLVPTRHAFTNVQIYKWVLVLQFALCGGGYHGKFTYTIITNLLLTWACRCHSRMIELGQPGTNHFFINYSQFTIMYGFHCVSNEALDRWKNCLESRSDWLHAWSSRPIISLSLPYNDIIEHSISQIYYHTMTSCNWKFLFSHTGHFCPSWFPTTIKVWSMIVGGMTGSWMEAEGV